MCSEAFLTRFCHVNLLKITADRCKMIIYTNEGNPLGLQLLVLAKFAKKTAQVQLVNLNGKMKKKSTAGRQRATFE